MCIYIVYIYYSWVSGCEIYIIRIYNFKIGLERLDLFNFHEQAMSERDREIALHKDMLRAQMKATESERQTIRSLCVCTCIICIYYV